MADEGYGLQESAMKLGDYLVSTNKIGEQQMWILTTNKWKSFLSYSQGNMVKYCFNYLLIHKIQDYHTPRLILLTQGSCYWKKLQSCLKSSWANMFNALALTFILFYFILSIWRFTNGFNFWNLVVTLVSPVYLEKVAEQIVKL